MKATKRTTRVLYEARGEHDTAEGTYVIGYALEKSIAQKHARDARGQVTVTECEAFLVTDAEDEPLGWVLAQALIRFDDLLEDPETLEAERLHALAKLTRRERNLLGL